MRLLKLCIKQFKQTHANKILLFLIKNFQKMPKNSFENQDQTDKIIIENSRDEYIFTADSSSEDVTEREKEIFSFRH